MKKEDLVYKKLCKEKDPEKLFVLIDEFLELVSIKNGHALSGMEYE
ncbi:MAG: hypothetical protein ACREAK_11565 [Nitrosarchaeum sp.]